MYQAILLDVYGTLVHDDDDSTGEVCARIAALTGVEPSAVAATWSRRLEASAAVAYASRFRTLADLTLGSLAETVTEFGMSLDVEQLCRGHLQSWRRPPLYDDSLPFLAAVKVPVCLVSDVDHDDLAAVLEFHGIAVSAVVTSEQARAYKPRPEPFQLALARLGLGPGEVIHIGDSASSDVAGAAALGVDTAFLDRRGTGLPAGVAATCTAATLTALLPRLRRGGSATAGRVP